MTTLSANSPRDMVVGDRNAHAVIASDIIYEGAAVGLVAASGHARPLSGGDAFAGFAEAKADNSSGSAADINVRVIRRGAVKLSVSGAVITDVGQPVYATDDDTFVFLPTGGTFIGFVRRWISSGVVEVEFDAGAYADPYGGGVYETVSGTKTLDAEDNGKTLFVDTDAFVITLPAVATGVNCRIVNIGAFGTVAVTISPAAADLIYGPDITAADDKDLINTKATARRGDRVDLSVHDADGYVVTDVVGTWAREA